MEVEFGGFGLSEGEGVGERCVEEGCSVGRLNVVGGEVSGYEGQASIDCAEELRVPRCRIGFLGIGVGGIVEAVT